MPNQQTKHPWRRLEAARSAAGYSTAAAAARVLGMSASTYSAYENGTRRITEEAALRFARFFGAEDADQFVETKDKYRERKRRIAESVQEITEIPQNVLTKEDVPIQKGYSPATKIKRILKVFGTDAISPYELFLMRSGRLLRSQQSIDIDLDDGTLRGVMPNEMFEIAEGAVFFATQPDDSMTRETYPFILRGATVFYNVLESAEPGDLVYAVIRNHSESIFRQYEREYIPSRRLTIEKLVPLNRHFEAYEMGPEDKIIGRVVAINQTYVLYRQKPQHLKHK